MGMAAKENSLEFSGILPSAFAESNRHAAKPAAKTDSTGSRRALAPKPANVRQQNSNSPCKVEKRRRVERETGRGPGGLHTEPLSSNTQASAVLLNDGAGAKKPRLNVMEELSGDEETEDESGSAGVSTPLANLAARRTHSRSRALYPRPRIPRDLGTLELDFVTTPKEPSLDDYTKAFFETLAAQHPRAQPTPEVITMDEFPDLEIDLSSSEAEDDPVAELKTPSH